MKYFIANWKAHKDIQETKDWLIAFTKHLKDGGKVTQALSAGKITVIIAPPYPLIPIVKEALLSYPNIQVGAQDVSSLDEGDVTGEVAAHSLFGLVGAVIIGHSSRRDVLKEEQVVLENKSAMAKKYGIKTIFCVRGEKDPIPQGVEFVAYEPVHLIGTRESEDLNTIMNVKKSLTLPAEVQFIYGAGVTEGSMEELLASSEIDGFLIGAASLDPSEFYGILEAAC